MSLSPPSTFLCVVGSCTVVDKNAHTIGAIQVEYYIFIRRLWKAGEKMDCGMPITNETYCMITVFRKGLKGVKDQFLMLAIYVV
jgi:hypothetical protein